MGTYIQETFKPSEYHCEKNYYDNYTLQEDALNQIGIQQVDLYTFVFLSPIVMMGSLSVIYVYLKYKKMRDMPGYIYLFISLSQFLNVFNFFLVAVNQMYYGEPTNDNDNFCMISSVLSVIATYNELAYNLFFCFFILRLIQNPLANYKQLNIIFSIINLFISLILVLIAKSYNYLGKNLFGTCSIKAGIPLNYFGVFEVLIQGIIQFYTIYKFKKLVPEYNIRMRESKEDFIGYQMQYVKVNLFLWLMIVIGYSISNLNCYQYHDEKINFLTSTTNILKLISPLTLTYLRFKDKYLRNKLRDIFSSYVPNTLKFSSKKESINLEDPLILQENVSRLINQELEKKSTIKSNYIEQIQTDMKLIYGLSIICGLLYHNQEYDPKSKRINQNDFKEEIEYQIDQKLVQDKLPRQNQVLEKKNYQIKKIKLKVFAPKIFNKILKMDHSQHNLDFSFDIQNNIKNIKYGSQADGGKGQFFIFSHDNRWILKTMMEDDFNFMRENLQDYLQHLIENQADTLISKIYGIYTFYNQDLQQNIIVMLQRNLSGCPKSNIKRTYDLKGSTFQRRVSFQEQIDFSRVLKDQDFISIEKKLHIPQTIKSKIYNAIVKDTQYFCKHQIMDYSLLVMVNQLNQMVDHQDLENQTKQNLSIIQSTQNPNIFYHLAIIDYLQKYNSNKMIEKYAKKTINLDPKLNTSTQDPQTYKDRFCNFLKQIIDY